ncbi:polysaccharide deacetylase family protein [Tropicimonas sp. IMCC34043]|uniref:polysaccharide deacetylase family protein n=1 Tax=Tropicimonas sp. IMCC34043 TaxID=2248760 RepID=UPI000E28288C|nr:polysaccharide deacetylase family protein [Tropicimonas sp. IMCC34043]
MTEHAPSSGDVLPRPRDLVGYGPRPPQIRWPNGAGLALNFVLNVEEGSEYSLDLGDGRSESALTEVRASRVPRGQRDLAAESMYEYGSRVGFWRLHRLFTTRGLPLTVFASAMALERTPGIAQAIAAAQWDVCAHGWRWIEHYLLDPATEAKHIREAHDSILNSVGRAPTGWYCRYSASEATRTLVSEHGGYLYDSDAYNDDLPYWTRVGERDHLVIPYTMTNNDAKFVSGDVFSASQFAEYLIDTFDVLHAESADVPRMMSVGLHSRVIGHPGRIAGLIRFLDYLQGKSGVWICNRDSIARHWTKLVPPAQEAHP